jgi:glucose uptake protein GlcU
VNESPEHGTKPKHKIIFTVVGTVVSATVAFFFLSPHVDMEREWTVIFAGIFSGMMCWHFYSSLSVGLYLRILKYGDLRFITKHP